LVVPDYAYQPTVAGLLAAWNRPGQLISSRYHAALIGAWAGCRTVVFPRSLKVRSAADELGLATVNDFADPTAVARQMRDAPPADPAVLRQQLESARQAFADCLADIAG
jgi:polysaccharide pyruvyl transferase WcaK-like protein